MMTKTLDLDKIRKKLEAERNKLRDQIEAQEGNTDGGATNPDRSDLAWTYDIRQRKSAWIEQLEQQVTQIEEAIDRLDEGTYGNCVRCGNQIANARLEAKPYANLCIQCQEELEKR